LVAKLISKIKIKIQPAKGEFYLESETAAIGVTDTVTPKLKQKGPSKTHF